MATRVGVERMTLSQHMELLKDEICHPHLGYTEQALVDEMFNQDRLLADVEGLEGYIDPEEETLVKHVRSMKETIKVNKACVHHLKGITELEDYYSFMAHLNAKRSLELCSDAHGTGVWKRKLPPKIRKAWKNIEHYSELVSLHSQNAADFHQFHSEAIQVEFQLNTKLNELNLLDQNLTHDHLVTAKDLAATLAAQREAMLELADSARSLLVKSDTIVPIYMRTKKNEGDLRGIMLCDYSTRYIDLKAGEVVYVRDTQPPGEDTTHSSYSGCAFTGGMSTDIGSTPSETVETTATTTSIVSSDETTTDQSSYSGCQHCHPHRDESTATDTTSCIHDKFNECRDHLRWVVTKSDQLTTAKIPSVCVWLPPRDREFRSKALKVNRTVCSAWSDIVDYELRMAELVYEDLFKRLISHEKFTTEDDESFERLLSAIKFRLSAPDFDRTAKRNQQLIEMMTQVEERWTRSHEASESIHRLEKTEITENQKVLDLIIENIHAAKHYEESLRVKPDVKETITQLSESNLKVIESLTILKKLARRDVTKLNDLLVDLRSWNRVDVGQRWGTQSSASSCSLESSFGSISGRLSGDTVSSNESISSSLAYSYSSREIFVEEEEEIWQSQRDEFSHERGMRRPGPARDHEREALRSSFVHVPDMVDPYREQQHGTVKTTYTLEKMQEKTKERYESRKCYAVVGTGERHNVVFIQTGDDSGAGSLPLTKSSTVTTAITTSEHTLKTHDASDLFSVPGPELSSASSARNLVRDSASGSIECADKSSQYTQSVPLTISKVVSPGETMKMPEQPDKMISSHVRYFSTDSTQRATQPLELPSSEPIKLQQATIVHRNIYRDETTMTGIRPPLSFGQQTHDISIQPMLVQSQSSQPGIVIRGLGKVDSLREDKATKLPINKIIISTGTSYIQESVPPLIIPEQYEKELTKPPTPTIQPTSSVVTAVGRYDYRKPASGPELVVSSSFCTSPIPARATSTSVDSTSTYKKDIQQIIDRSTHLTADKPAIIQSLTAQSYQQPPLGTAVSIGSVSEHLVSSTPPILVNSVSEHTSSRMKPDTLLVAHGSSGVSPTPSLTMHVQSSGFHSAPSITKPLTPTRQLVSVGTSYAKVGRQHELVHTSVSAASDDGITTGVTPTIQPPVMLPPPTPTAQPTKSFVTAVGHYDPRKPAPGPVLVASRSFFESSMPAPATSPSVDSASAYKQDSQHMIERSIQRVSETTAEVPKVMSVDTSTSFHLPAPPFVPTKPVLTHAGVTATSRIEIHQPPIVCATSTQHVSSKPPLLPPTGSVSSTVGYYEPSRVEPGLALVQSDSFFTSSVPTPRTATNIETTSAYKQEGQSLIERSIHRTADKPTIVQAITTQSYQQPPVMEPATHMLVSTGTCYVKPSAPAQVTSQTLSKVKLEQEVKYTPMLIHSSGSLLEHSLKDHHQLIESKAFVPTVDQNMMMVDSLTTQPIVARSPMVTSSVSHAASWRSSVVQTEVEHTQRPVRSAVSIGSVSEHLVSSTPPILVNSVSEHTSSRMKPDTLLVAHGSSGVSPTPSLTMHVQSSGFHSAPSITKPLTPTRQLVSVGTSYAKVGRQHELVHTSVSAASDDGITTGVTPTIQPPVMLPPPTPTAQPTKSFVTAVGHYDPRKPAPGPVLVASRSFFESSMPAPATSPSVDSASAYKQDSQHMIERSIQRVSETTTEVPKVMSVDTSTSFHLPAPPFVPTKPVLTHAGVTATSRIEIHQPPIVCATSTQHVSSKPPLLPPTGSVSSTVGYYEPSRVEPGLALVQSDSFFTSSVPTPRTATNIETTSAYKQEGQSLIERSIHRTADKPTIVQAITTQSYQQPPVMEPATHMLVSTGTCYVKPSAPAQVTSPTPVISFRSVCTSVGPYNLPQDDNSSFSPLDDTIINTTSVPNLEYQYPPKPKTLQSLKPTFILSNSVFYQDAGRTFRDQSTFYDSRDADSAEIGVQTAMLRGYELREDKISIMEEYDEYSSNLTRHLVREVGCMTTPAIHKFELQVDLVPETRLVGGTCYDDSYCSEEIVDEQQLFYREKKIHHIYDETEEDDDGERFISVSSTSSDYDGMNKLPPLFEHATQTPLICADDVRIAAQMRRYFSEDLIQLIEAGRLYLADEHHMFDDRQCPVYNPTTNTYILDQTRQEDSVATDTDSMEEYLRPMSILSTIVQIRQRISQYELVVKPKLTSQPDWHDISQVASPTSGIFHSVEKALRRGWIEIGDRNVYGDPKTGHMMPLIQAIQEHRIRMRRSTTTGQQHDQSHSRRGEEDVLLLIDRVYFNYRNTNLVSVVDTSTNQRMTPDEAVECGIIETEDAEIRFHDLKTGRHMTMEEAVSRNFVEVQQAETASESEASDTVGGSECRVSRVLQLKPGDASNIWIDPFDAESRGLFDRKTGRVARSWPGYPNLPPRMQDVHSDETVGQFIATDWYEFMTAYNSGMVRTEEQLDACLWIETYDQTIEEQDSVIVYHHVELVAPEQESLEFQRVRQAECSTPMPSRRTRGEPRYGMRSVEQFTTYYEHESVETIRTAADFRSRSHGGINFILPDE